MIKALLFDLYDTLATIDIDVYRATKAEMAKRAGFPADVFLKSWKNYTRPSAQGEVLTVEERVARVMRDLGTFPEIEIVREIATLEYKLQLEDVHLFDTVDESLEYFKRKGLKMGLVTNTPSSTCRVPAILGIESYFDTMVFSFNIGVLKPDPRIYLTACSNLGVKPVECIFTGDGNDCELDGAHSLGMVTVKVGPGRDEVLRHEQSQAYDFRIEKIEGLKEIIEKPSLGNITLTKIFPDFP